MITHSSIMHICMTCQCAFRPQDFTSRPCLRTQHSYWALKPPNSLRQYSGVTTVAHDRLTAAANYSQVEFLTW